MLTDRAKDSWSRNITFEPERGKILDRNGVELATNKSAPTVFVVPRQIEKPAETAEKLAAVLGVEKDEIYKRVTKKESIVRLDKGGRKISHDKAKEVRGLSLKGVYIAEDSIRYYPFGNFLSHVLGFAGSDNQGLMGLEKYYDKELNGDKGHVRFLQMQKDKECLTLVMISKNQKLD